VVAGALVVIALLFSALWKWTGLREWVDPERLADLAHPYRRNWLALPVVVVVFVVAELLLFPVLVLIFVCGLAFGPWLGSLYAICGSLASALVAFFLGRRLGRRRLERWGGGTVRNLMSKLERRGVIAVFLVRKVPAPFTLVNLVCGAAPLSVSQFVYGTLLGMGTGIILLTVLGSQVLEVLYDPRPERILLGIGLLSVPLVLALLVQRAMNRRAGAQ
jgi:phospholipase D1/2